MKNYYQVQQILMDQIKKEKTKPRLLLHTCCALCFSSAFLQCKDLFQITVFFFNPNIYPLEEYEKRKKETLRLIQIFSQEFHMHIDFVEKKEDFEHYQKKKIHQHHCYDCIYNRLLNAYVYAEKNHFDYVTTTLTVGRLKDSYMINLIGETLEPTFKCKYFYSDFKKNKGIDLSLQMKEKYQIYAQNYCGCETYKHTF